MCLPLSIDVLVLYKFLRMLYGQTTEHTYMYTMYLGQNVKGSDCLQANEVNHHRVFWSKKCLEHFPFQNGGILLIRIYVYGFYMYICVQLSFNAFQPANEPINKVKLVAFYKCLRISKLKKRLTFPFICCLCWCWIRPSDITWWCDFAQLTSNHIRSHNLRKIA